jgi:hypothetical protein
MGTDDLFKKRRAKRKARKVETIEPRADSYLIACEGEKTEPLYFDAIAKEVKRKLGGNLDVPIINTFGEGRGTVKLVEKAIELVNRANTNYQHVWVVMDKDDFTDFDEAIEMARAHGFEVAWSNQCFEYQLYPHFFFSDSALHRNDWMSKLSEIFSSWGIRDEGYEKNLDDLYEIVSTYGDFPRAQANAQRMRERFSDGRPPSLRDPCTTVDLLVGELRRLCERD